MKSAFSMIELVFVIVILGIMAAVAVPKFSGIQDDALISTEKSTIGIVRQGIMSLYGKRLIRGEDFSITITDKNGLDYTSKVYFTTKYYPMTLDVAQISVTTDNNVSLALAVGKYQALALVVESEGLGDWSRDTIDLSTKQESLMNYKGPASNIVTDPNAEITAGNYWEYNNTSGKIIKKPKS